MLEPLPKGLIATMSLTSCESMKGFAVEDPVAYAFSHPEAKRILRAVLEKGGQGFEEVRAQVGIEHSETFHRVVRKLAQFDLVAVRAAPGAKFRKHRIPMVLEPTAKTERLVRVLHQLDQVVVENGAIVGQRTVQELAVL